MEKVEQKKEIAKILHFRPLFCCFIAILFGITVSRKIFSGDLTYIIVTSVSFAVLIILCAFYRKWISVLLITIAFFLGCGMYYLGIHCFYGKEYQGKQNVVGRVTDDIYETENYYNVVLDDCFINGESSKNISLSIYKNGDVEISAGVVLSFASYIDDVKLFTLGEFNSYYLRDKTPYEANVNMEDLTIVEGNLRIDEKIRSSLKNLLDENMNLDMANIAFATLTGDKTNLDSEIKDYYKGSGVVHILTVSGLHITILAGAVSWLLKKLKTNKYVNLAIIFVFLMFYCYICGWTPSVLRATVMTLTLLIARLVGEEYDSLNALSVAGIILLIISPLSAFDIGFLMSFACVFSIFCLSKPMTKYLQKFLPKYFSDGIAISLSAEIGILPFLVVMDSEINILSVFANILILPFFEIIFIILILFAFIGIIPYCGIILKLPDWCFKGITFIAQFFEGTFLKIRIEKIDLFITSLIYFSMFLLSYFFMISRKFKSLILSGIICISSLYIMMDKFLFSEIKSQIYSISYYGKSNYFLYNADGESLFVGNSFNNNDSKFLTNYGIKGIDYIVAINFIDEYVVLDIAKDYNVKEVISSAKITNSTLERTVNYDESVDIGNFVVEYTSNNGKYIGLKIYFDNKSIFFASEQKLSYNNMCYVEKNLSKDNIDYVFLGGRDELAEYFAIKNVFTYYNVNNKKYSFSKVGNICVDVKNDCVRSID